MRHRKHTGKQAQRQPSEVEKKGEGGGAEAFDFVGTFLLRFLLQYQHYLGVDPCATDLRRCLAALLRSIRTRRESKERKNETKETSKRQKEKKISVVWCWCGDAQRGVPDARACAGALGCRGSVAEGRLKKEPVRTERGSRATAPALFQLSLTLAVAHQKLAHVACSPSGVPLFRCLLQPKQPLRLARWQRELEKRKTKAASRATARSNCCRAERWKERRGRGVGQQNAKKWENRTRADQGSTDTERENQTMTMR